MKLVLISDTHQQHEGIKIPPCDVLIHAGDLTGRGSPARTQMTLEWLDKQPAKHVVCIAGNHDFFFENYPEAARDLIANTRVVYLQDSGVEISGVKFWGSPWTPEFMNWAFMYPHNRAGQWDKIPEDTQVLITHGPPFGVMDRTHPERFDSERLGCPILWKAVERIQPKIHVFGHIHGGYGHAHGKPETHFYNASQLNEEYKRINKPWEVEL